VIFSLVDRSMASSGSDANLSAARLYAAWVLRCDVDHAPTGCLSRLSPCPLVGFSRRRGLRGRSWLEGQRRVEPRQRRAQRIQARGVGISVAFDEATDCRCYCGQLVVGEVNRRHG
jgi:hypothetical protein